MTTITTTTTAVPERRTTDDVRRHARVAGLFYLITFAASIPALILISPVLDDPGGYITGPGQDDTRVLLGCFLDFANALAGIGTALAVYPIVKRVKQSMALGFVMSRMVEAAVIMIGVVSLLAVVTLREDLAGSDATGLATVGQALVAVRDWTFLFGPGFMAVFNALLFGTLLYTSRLVPRWIPTLGLIGAPLAVHREHAGDLRSHRAGLGGQLLRHPAVGDLGAVGRDLHAGQGLPPDGRDDGIEPVDRGHSTPRHDSGPPCVGRCRLRSHLP